MTIKKKTLLRATPFRLLALAGVVVLTSGFLFKMLMPPSPEAIRDRAIAAIEQKDVKTLCALADPEEQKRLNLDNAKVERLLNESLWLKRSPQHKSVHLFAKRPSDRRTWLISWQGDDAGQYPLALTVLDDPQKGWRLALSNLLYCGFVWKTQGQSSGGFWRRCRELGITGKLSQVGKYEPLPAPKQTSTAP